jgi:hypothetical protein
MNTTKPFICPCHRLTIKIELNIYSPFSMIIGFVAVAIQVTQMRFLFALLPPHHRKEAHILWLEIFPQIITVENNVD